MKIDKLSWSDGISYINLDLPTEEPEIELPELTNKELNTIPTFEEASSPEQVSYPLVLLKASNTNYIETIKERILEPINKPMEPGVIVSYISSNPDRGTGVVFFKGIFNIYIYNKIRKFGIEVLYYPRKGEKVDLKLKESLLEKYPELFDKNRYS